MGTSITETIQRRKNNMQRCSAQNYRNKPARRHEEKQKLAAHLEILFAISGVA